MQGQEPNQSALYKQKRKEKKSRRERNILCIDCNPFVLQATEVMYTFVMRWERKLSEQSKCPVMASPVHPSVCHFLSAGQRAVSQHSFHISHVNNSHASTFFISEPPIFEVAQLLIPRGVIDSFFLDLGKTVNCMQAVGVVYAFML